MSQAQVRGQQQRLDAWVARSVPQGRWKYLTAVFPDADTDVAIEHNLGAKRPDEVRYLVVGADRACSLYEDLSAARRPWSPNHCFLRASTAGAILRLLLFIEQTSTQ